MLAAETGEGSEESVLLATATAAAARSDIDSQMTANSILQSNV